MPSGERASFHLRAWKCEPACCVTDPERYYCRKIPWPDDQ